MAGTWQAIADDVLSERMVIPVFAISPPRQENR